MNNNIKKITYERNRILIYNPPSELNQSFISSLTEYSNYNKFAKKILFQAIKYIKLEDNKYVLCIPRFYPSKYLQQYFPDYIVEDNLNSEYNKFDTIELNCKYEPRDYRQEEALNYLHSRGDFYYTRKFDYKKTLVMQTGLGKTYCTIKYICDSGLKTLITVHKKSLFNEPWKKDLFKFTDIKEEEYLEINDSTTIKRVLKSPEKFKDIKVAIVCTKTIGSLLKTDVGIKLLQDFMSVMKFGLKVHDEAHIDYKVLTLIDFYLDLYRTINLSATPRRSNFSSNKIYKYILPSENYWFGLQEEFRKNPHINYVFHTFNSKPDEIDQHNMLKRPGVNPSAYSDYLINNGFDNILEQVLPYIKKMYDKKYKTVLMCSQINLVNKFKEIIPEYIEDITIGDYTGNIKDNDLKSKQFDNDLIITTDKSLDAGNDFCINCLINLVCFGSDVPVEQISGRVRDIPNSPCLYIDMVDLGFVRIEQQYNKKKSFIKKNIAKNLTIIKQ